MNFPYRNWEYLNSISDDLKMESLRKELGPVARRRRQLAMQISPVRLKKPQGTGIIDLTDEKVGFI